MSSSPSIILHKRNSTPNVVPALSAIVVGEISINTHDGIFFTKTTRDTVESFSGDSLKPYTLNTELSSIAPQYGSNTANESFAVVLGGYNNNATGAGSVIVNGESNLNDGDLALICTGINNKIGLNGAISCILGGENNTIEHQNCFTLGSNLSSHADNFTYVNNISGTYFGDGRNLTNVAAITSVPNTSSSSGFPGQIAIDTNHLYVCVNMNTWKRVALSDW